jgi:hypothetical protein
MEDDANNAEKDVAPSTDTSQVPTQPEDSGTPLQPRSVVRSPMIATNPGEAVEEQQQSRRGRPIRLPPRFEDYDMT